MTSNGHLFEPEPSSGASDPEQLEGSLAPASEPVGQRPRPTPHLSKLRELLNNTKVPDEDRNSIQEAVDHYHSWTNSMRSLESVGEQKVRDLVGLLNSYKAQVELGLIWDSESDFLFRQRGQLKIDNSIIEEFLPWLVDKDLIPELEGVDVFAGPASAYAATHFSSTLVSTRPEIGMKIRTKDQDFTLSRQAFMESSFDNNFPRDASDRSSFWIAYFACECKTNLDKTMFQEASATSHDLKVAVPAARYYLMCEYLDMTPISTSGTDIDEVLILRGKRLGSHRRKSYASAASRKNLRGEYVDFLESNPIRSDVVMRFVEHLRSLFSHRDPDENDALEKGFF